MSTFLHLDDRGHAAEHLIRLEHISAAEIRRADGVITLRLLGGQTIQLSHEESKPFLHHLKEDHGHQGHGPHAHGSHAEVYPAVHPRH